MKLSLRHKLLAAFGLDLLLMMALGLFASIQMHSMHEKASFVEHHTMPSQTNVARIEKSLTTYRSLLLEYLVLTNRSDRDRIVGQLREVERTQEEQLVVQSNYLAGPAQEEAYRQLEAAWNAFTTATHERFLPSTQFENTGTVQPSFSRMNPLYDKLARAVQHLSDLTQQQATGALGESRATYRGARQFIFADTFLSLVISAAIGLVLASTLAQRIQRLTKATIAVAGGDLKRRVEAEGGDELETLAHNFNHMVVKLREKQVALEEQNHALEHSLEQQRLLTEDLVRRKESEEEALRARSAAEAASQAKSYFLATMSHELRTPLNAILGFAQILQLEAERSGETRGRQELHRIQLAGKHLLNLISNVLDFSKIEQGKVDLALASVDIRPLAHEVITLVEPLARTSGNQLHFECPEDLGTACWDAGKVRQILFNLLSNAVKFTEHGEVVLLVEPFTHDGDEWIRFAVRDTGIGIGTEEIQKLFQPFGQVHSTTTRNFDGSGLGLVVSRQLSQLMGGNIQVESQLGVGSTFTVTLPCSPPPQRAAA